jgi:conjugal transfer mating pair stabilization protein TraG
MAVAGEAASASFGLGQTSFYNTTANTMSANKHDTNWTHMHGMHTEQMGSGVLKTLTGSGEAVFDVTPGMSRGPVHISDAQAMSGSLNQAYEESKQAAKNESQHYQSALSNFAHSTIQLSQMKGHDMRLGDGVSASESGQYNQALATMTHIASDVAKRLGITQEDALARMTSAGLNAHAGVSSEKSMLGNIGRFAFGATAGVDTHAKGERTATSSDRYHEGTDSSVSAKEAQDFNQALNYVIHFARTHHFDNSHSEGASLSNQLGSDLREAQTASHNRDASLSKAARISNARSYVESHSDQMNTDLNQAFSGYVAHRVGEKARDALYAHPEDMSSLQKLQSLGQEFLSEQRDELIARFGNEGKTAAVEGLYQQGAKPLQEKMGAIGVNYQKNHNALQVGGTIEGVGIDTTAAQQVQGTIHYQIEQAEMNTRVGGGRLKAQSQGAKITAHNDMAQGKEKGQANLNPILPKSVSQWVSHHK